MKQNDLYRHQHPVFFFFTGRNITSTYNTGSSMAKI